MVNDGPARLVEPQLESEVRHPPGFLAQIALLPVIVMVGLQRNLRVEKLFGQPLQQRAGDESVEVAFMRQDDFRFGQLLHGGRITKSAPRGERGIVWRANAAAAASRPAAR